MTEREEIEILSKTLYNTKELTAYLTKKGNSIVIYGDEKGNLGIQMCETNNNNNKMHCLVYGYITSVDKPVYGPYHPSM
jgi:hypothetical protein